MKERDTRKLSIRSYISKHFGQISWIAHQTSGWEGIATIEEKQRIESALKQIRSHCDGIGAAMRLKGKGKLLE